LIFDGNSRKGEVVVLEVGDGTCKLKIVEFFEGIMLCKMLSKLPFVYLSFLKSNHMNPKL